jgi:hypothetical protein
MQSAQQVGAVTALCCPFVQPSAQQNGSAVRTTAIIVAMMPTATRCTVRSFYANRTADQWVTRVEGLKDSARRVWMVKPNVKQTLIARS